MATAQQQLETLLASMTDPLADKSQHVTGMIYGDNGGGKTVTAIKLAKAIAEVNGGEVLFVDAVNAWRSLKNHPELHGGIKRVAYDGKAQLDLIVMALEAGKLKDFSVIILDEASSMTDRDGDIILATRAAQDSSKDPDVLTQPDMGATTERMRRTITSLLRQEISVIFVAHQRQDEDKAVGYKVTRPRFMPKFSGTIREGLDFVVHMTAEPTKVGDRVTYARKLQVNPTKTVIAKTRIGGLGLYTDPDTFIRTTVEWMKGNAEDNSTNEVINDVPLDVAGESDNDFGGLEIQ